MGSRVQATASARSKSAKAAVVEALEGKVATAFSKSAKLGSPEKGRGKGKNPKKDPAACP